MSAWIVSKAHIDVLVHALGKRELLPDGMSPDQAGLILWAENHRSVNCRYQENAPTPAYAYSVPPVRWTPDQMTKIVGCYDYQSCETRDYRATDAAELIAILTESLSREGADGDSPEANSAPWGICDCGGAHEGWKCPLTAQSEVVG